MRTVVAFPGTMAHAQQSARSLLDAGCLIAFVTTFAHRDGGHLDRWLTHVPGRGAQGALRQLRRRAVIELPSNSVQTHPAWEILRTIAVRAGAGPIAVDRIWDRLSHHFDDVVAQRHVPNAQAIMAFEYTALAAFEAAKRLGVARILQLPSRDSRESEEIKRREQARWPALCRTEDPYFAAQFERRYARRQHEIAAADLVVANSSLTGRSHIAAGADPCRVAVVPLAAPPPVDPAYHRLPPTSRPLAVVWAGGFNLMKGAPYLLEAWSRLKAGAAARLDVYGQVDLPRYRIASLAGSLEQIAFHGSVPQAQLFSAYDAADILVVPTLSDGFGMVVLEAMSRGLPVIVTDQAGAAELVTPANGLVVPAADTLALVDALQWCLDNRERLADMRHAALATAMARQWSDYRRDLLAALTHGLRQAGYVPAFGLPP